SLQISLIPSTTSSQYVMSWYMTAPTATIAAITARAGSAATTQAAAIVAAEATAPAAAAAQPAITLVLNAAHATPARPRAMPRASSALTILSPFRLKNR